MCWSAITDPARIRDRALAFLARPRAAKLAIALGVLLAAPSLFDGLGADDWLQSLIARGLHPFAGLPDDRFDLFSFAGRDPRTTPLLIDAGIFPWWTDPHIRLAFFRPLTALTHVADWTLWPSSPPLMHAQSLLWFALALLAVAAFYRRFLSGAAVGLATLAYAVDDAHAPAVGWLANRNALVAVACAMPVLVLHDRWRRDGFRPGAWLAPLLFAIALLAGESSIAICGYLFAYALLLEQGPLPARLGSIARYALVVIGWRVVYHALGYGTAGSGVYLNPLSSPLAFLAALPSRAAFLLAAQFALPWSDFANLWPFVSPRAARLALAVAVLTVAFFVAVFLPLLRRDRVSRFLALGMLLALLPVCSTFPADRLLWFVGVGAMGLIARWLELAPKSGWRRPVALLVVLIHLGLAPLLLAFRSARAIDAVRRPVLRADLSLPLSAAGTTLVLVNPVSDFIPSYLQLLRWARGDRPPRLRWLWSGAGALTLSREDERTLRVRPEHGFLESLGERMLRDPDRRGFTIGDVVRLDDLSIEITEVLPDGRPAETRVRFDRPLEDPSLVWAAWDQTAFKPFTPPAVGERAVLPAVDLLKALFPR